MANPDKPPLNEADQIIEHLSDTVFPSLPYDCFPEKIEWLSPPACLELACGCVLEVLPGDTVWVDEDADGEQVFLAIDPVTIH